MPISAHAQPLLEREAALDALLAAVPGAAVGGGSVAIVGGEAGGGKTSLVRWFAQSASARVLWSACEALFTPRPLGPVYDIARELGGPALKSLESGADRASWLATLRSVLESLEAQPERKAFLPRLAHHADAAGEAEAVLRYATAAGAHATSVGAHREAAAQYARVLRYAESQPPAVRGGLFFTEQAEEAIAAVERALAAYIEAGDRLKEGAALCLLARIRMQRDGVAPAMPAAIAAVEALERLPPGPELAMAYATLSRFCMNLDDAPGTINWGGRALEIAERAGDTERRIHVLTTIATMERRSSSASACECVVYRDSRAAHERRRRRTSHS